MYESLQRNCKDFHLYIFAFDDKCSSILTTMSLNNVSIIKLNEFEDQELLNVKPSRSSVEYCWTCTPSIILYSIEKFNLPNCTYLDADLYFYSSPSKLIQEMGTKSVLITEHRYTPKYDQTAISGRFCVQFVTFKSNEIGLNVLKWWRNACLNWCYMKSEDGKFGDQKYLDDWPEMFEGIHILNNLGGGVAPWNVQQYELYKSKNNLCIKDISTNQTENLVFYHFHGIKFFTGGIVDLNSDYFIPNSVKNILYKGYLYKLNQIKSNVSIIDSTFDPNGTKSGKSLKTYCLSLWYKLKHTYNFVRLEDFIK
jgi:hypothetical protein